MLVCFGRNTEGQTDVPALPADEHWVRVRSGGHFTCATTSSGAIKCWGCRADAPPNPVDPDGCKFGRGQTLVPHGQSTGHVLCGFQIPKDDRRDLEASLVKTGYPMAPETDNIAYDYFLKA